MAQTHAHNLNHQVHAVRPRKSHGSQGTSWVVNKPFTCQNLAQPFHRLVFQILLKWWSNTALSWVPVVQPELRSGVRATLRPVLAFKFDKCQSARALSAVRSLHKRWPGAVSAPLSRRCSCCSDDWVSWGKKGNSLWQTRSWLKALTLLRRRSDLPLWQTWRISWLATAIPLERIPDSVLETSVRAKHTLVPGSPSTAENITVIRHRARAASCKCVKAKLRGRAC